MIAPESPPERELSLAETFRANKLKPNQRKFLRCLQRTLVIQDAAKDAGISERTAYYWLAKPRFRSCYDAAIMAAVPAVELAHFHAATGKDTLARIHILKNRHPAYREKPLEVYTTDTTPHSQAPNSQVGAMLAGVMASAINLLTKHAADRVVQTVTELEVLPSPVKP